MTATAAPTIDCEPVAAHYTPQRQQQLAELAGQPISWQPGAFKWIDGDEGAIDAFRRLLLRLDRYQDLFQGRRLCRAGGRYTSAIIGLAALAHHHASWIRPPESWSTAVEHNGHPQRADQFGSLARHLLARFDVPTFLDEVWFGPFEADTLRRQGWFLHLAAGGSVRDLDLPIHLTRRMAHRFMQGRNRDSVDHNLRWAQVLGLGGDQALARTIMSTRLGRHLDDDEFWRTVVLFLATNPLLDPVQVGPMIDYVHNMKFAPRRVVAEGGGVEQAPPPHPDFVMKGRSATKLLRQVEDWHGDLVREDVVFQSWQPAGIRTFELEETTEELGSVRWTVQELLSSWELAAEGTAMGHCVVSYSNQCADGQTSIWSIGLRRADGNEREGIMTVAVDVARRAVTQARGKYNMIPHQMPRSAQARDIARGAYMKALNRSDFVLKRWIERERLRNEA